MPATPGTSAEKVIDPSIHSETRTRTKQPTNPIASYTKDPFFGIEVGRTV